VVRNDEALIKCILWHSDGVLGDLSGAQNTSWQYVSGYQGSEKTIAPYDITHPHH
jgi:hypothetical protein